MMFLEFFILCVYLPKVSEENNKKKNSYFSKEEFLGENSKKRKLI